MKKSLKLGLGSVIVTGALGAVLVPAVSASAAVVDPSTVCAASDNAFEVPFAFAKDGTPQLAGIVCIVDGTSQFDSVWIAPGFTAEVKAEGTGITAKTNVRFFNPTTRDKAEFRDENGQTQIR